MPATVPPPYPSSPRLPTAQRSLAVPSMASRKFCVGLGLGLGTVDQAEPFQRTMWVRRWKPTAASPTAHALLVSKTLTARSVASVAPAGDGLETAVQDPPFQRPVSGLAPAEPTAHTLLSALLSTPLRTVASVRADVDDQDEPSQRATSARVSAEPTAQPEVEVRRSTPTSRLLYAAGFGVGTTDQVAAVAGDAGASTPPATTRAAPTKRTRRFDMVAPPLAPWRRFYSRDF